MPAAPPPSGQSDNSTGILWIVAGIFVFGAIIWMAFKADIIDFYFKIKLFEIGLISYFTPNLDDVRATILMTNPNSVTFEDLVRIGEVVGSYIRVPLLLLLLVLAVTIYFTNSTRVFKRVYTMKDLAQLEKDNWPQITPVVNLDLVNTDIDKGPWAMALTPMQFCKRFKLLEEYKRGPQEGVMRRDWDRIEVKLKRGEANKVFSMQLGPLWQGTDKLPLHVKALFAAFAARIETDTKSAQDLFARMSASSGSKLDFSGVHELCQKHISSKIVQQIISNHAYVLTVMASMLEASRMDGVQASADFLWLKPVDRRLWYVLNTVGRQTPFVEVAGVFAHWLAEKELGRKIFIPMVEEATTALDLSLKEIIYRPDEEPV